MQLNFDVIIVGAGCAGMTAAIYLKRANINVLMIDNYAPGGQINKTFRIDNYPGFTTVDGPTLALNMFAQTQELNIEYRYGNVLEVNEIDDYKIIKTDKEEITCKSVIIATGRKAKELGLDNEKKLSGKGISWCAICDGPLFKEKDVVVIGGGNSALEESEYLSEVAKKVTIVHRNEDFTGDKILQTKVIENNKIEVINNSEIIKIDEENGYLSGVELQNKVTGEKTPLKTDGLFIYIGFEPVSKLLEKTDVNVQGGYIEVDENMRTNVKGIYACGDVIKKELYQIATAIGEGAKAAYSAIQDLK